MNSPAIETGIRGDKSLLRWIKTRDLSVFFVMTFLFVFGGWIAAVFTGIGALFDIGLWGPAISAIFLTAVTRGKQGLKDLLHRLLLWRVPARWYLIIIFGWPAISILAALLHAQITKQPVGIHWTVWTAAQTFLNSALILGFWACEEIGWRGFALPRLLNRWNALFSSIVLGAAWWLWHLPYFIGAGGINPAFYPYLALTVTVSILMTWIFNHTKGSIFVATFFHFYMNVYDAFQADKLLSADPGGVEMIRYWLLAASAILITAFYGYRTLTRTFGICSKNVS